MHSQNFLEEMKQKLLEAKEQFEIELAGLHAHTEMGDDLDSNAEEVNTDEASQNIIARLKSDLEKIEMALEKIEDGTYGTDNDGKEISEARLKVLPWADKAI